MVEVRSSLRNESHLLSDNNAAAMNSLRKNAISQNPRLREVYFDARAQGPQQVELAR